MPTGERRARGTADAEARHVHLVDGVEHAARVADEDVGEAGRETTTREHGRVVRAGLLVEREQRADRGVVVGDRRERDAAFDGRLRERGVGGRGHGRRDRVDLRREHRVVGERPRLGTVVQRLGDRARAALGAAGDEHPVDTARVEQLARGAHAGLTETDDEDGDHRKSGPCSSRQPPLVCGTRPLPRTLTTTLTAAAIAATSRPRW